MQIALRQPCHLLFPTEPLRSCRIDSASVVIVAGSQYTLPRVKIKLVADRARGPRQGVELSFIRYCGWSCLCMLILPNSILLARQSLFLSTHAWLALRLQRWICMTDGRQNRDLWRVHFPYRVRVLPIRWFFTSFSAFRYHFVLVSS